MGGTHGARAHWMLFRTFHLEPLLHTCKPRPRPRWAANILRLRCLVAQLNLTMLFLAEQRCRWKPKPDAAAPAKCAAGPTPPPTAAAARPFGSLRGKNQASLALTDFSHGFAVHIRQLCSGKEPGLTNYAPKYTERGKSRSGMRGLGGGGRVPRRARS